MHTCYPNIKKVQPSHQKHAVSKINHARHNFDKHSCWSRKQLLHILYHQIRYIRAARPLSSTRLANHSSHTIPGYYSQAEVS